MRTFVHTTLNTTLTLSYPIVIIRAWPLRKDDTQVSSFIHFDNDIFNAHQPTPEIKRVSDKR